MSFLEVHLIMITLIGFHVAFLLVTFFHVKRKHRRNQLLLCACHAENGCIMEAPFTPAIFTGEFLALILIPNLY